MAHDMLPGILTTALRPLPLAPLDLAFKLVMGQVLRRHRRIFDRLEGHAGKRYGIDPVDLPFAFVLTPLPSSPRIRVLRDLPMGLDAVITGPILQLVGLVEGSFDGDALFFSRSLSVEGDIESVLALRNAIDDARIDLIGEAFGALGPLAVPATRAVRAIIAEARARSATTGDGRQNSGLAGEA